MHQCSEKQAGGFLAHYSHVTATGVEFLSSFCQSIIVTDCCREGIHKYNKSFQQHITPLGLISYYSWASSCWFLTLNLTWFTKLYFTFHISSTCQADVRNELQPCVFVLRSESLVCILTTHGTRGLASVKERKRSISMTFGKKANTSL